MTSVPPRAAVNEMLLRDGHQAECVIKLPIGQQSGIGGDTRTVELQLETAVEIEPESIRFGFTLAAPSLASIQRYKMLKKLQYCLKCQTLPINNSANNNGAA
jgi:hypothetical protein